jgi:hypothetical protein
MRHAHDSRDSKVPKTIGTGRLAETLDVSKGLVRKWHREGILRGVLLKGKSSDRGRLVFLESDVLCFLAERGIRPREVA